jgi:hypothetical protein
MLISASLWWCGGVDSPSLQKKEQKKGEKGGRPGTLGVSVQGVTWVKTGQATGALYRIAAVVYSVVHPPRPDHDGHVSFVIQDQANNRLVCNTYRCSDESIAEEVNVAIGRALKLAKLRKLTDGVKTTTPNLPTPTPAAAVVDPAVLIHPPQQPPPPRVPNSPSPSPSPSPSNTQPTIAPLFSEPINPFLPGATASTPPIHASVTLVNLSPDPKTSAVDPEAAAAAHTQQEEAAAGVEAQAVAAHTETNVGALHADTEASNRREAREQADAQAAVLAASAAADTAVAAKAVADAEAAAKAVAEAEAKEEQEMDRQLAAMARAAVRPPPVAVVVAPTLLIDRDEPDSTTASATANDGNSGTATATGGLDLDALEAAEMLAVEREMQAIQARMNDADLLDGSDEEGDADSGDASGLLERMRALLGDMSDDADGAMIDPDQPGLLEDAPTSTLPSLSGFAAAPSSVSSGGLQSLTAREASSPPRRFDAAGAAARPSGFGGAAVGNISSGTFVSPTAATKRHGTSAEAVAAFSAAQGGGNTQEQEHDEQEHASAPTTNRPRRKRSITTSESTLCDVPTESTVNLPAFGGPNAATVVQGPWLQVDALRPRSRGISVRVKVLDRLLALQHTAADGKRLTVTAWLVGDQTGCITLCATGPLALALHRGMDATLVNASTAVVDGQMQLVLGIYTAIHTTESGQTFHDSLIKRHNNCSF